MDAYKEFIEPTKISQSVGCNFISPNKKHLIVGKTSLLQIFEIIKDGKHHHLNLIQQFKLHGTIISIKPIKTIENPKLDYLLVATKFSKISLIKWNHELESIQTVSLHYYENVIQNATFEKLTTCSLIVEPKNACLCLRFKNLLTFLPFRKIDDDDDEDDEMEEDDNVLRLNDEIYDTSFLINGQNLDPQIGTIIDAQFLYNYRESTIAVLCLNSKVFAGNLYFKKDNISYIVLSLDLNTKKSTTVLKVDNLPYDIDRIVPLPKPLNGALLMGSNEFYHIDNGGIARKIAVNPFTPLITNQYKGFIDNTELNLNLEHCSVVPIPHDNKILMILRTGELYYINFDIDGKTMKRISLEKVENCSDINVKYPGDIACLDNNLLFISGANSDSPLIEYKYSESITNGRNKQEDDDMDDVYEDDEDKHEINKSGKLNLIKRDQLIHNGPISSFTYGYYSNERFKSNLINPNFGELSLFSNGGMDEESHMNIFTPSIQPLIKSSLTFSTINKLWITNNFLITSDDKNNKSEIFQINKNYARLNSKSFSNNEMTISIHELNNGKFIIQVTPKQIKVYDNRFKKKMNLSDVIKGSKESDKEPKNEDDEDEDIEVVNSFCNDEILMIFLTNGQVKILAINTYNESFTEISIPKILSDTLITTGYITNSNILNAVTKDSNLIKSKKRKHSEHGSNNSIKIDVNDLSPKQKVFILVTGDNRIVLFNRLHNERCYQLNDIDKFTDQLHLSFFESRQVYPDPFIKQVIFNEIGDSIAKNQYLTILTMGGEVLLYKLYFDGENFKFLKEKDLLITGAPHNSYTVNTKVEMKLFYIENLNGYTGVFISGDKSYCILKSHHSIPRIFKFTKIPIMSFGKFSDQLIFLDDKKNTRICELPVDFSYDNNWPLKRIKMNQTIKSITYHEQSNSFIVSTYKEIEYNCVDEENVPISGTMEDKPGAKSYKGLIKLISPMTWTVIDEFDLEDNEVGTNIKSMLLDVGSSNRRFKHKREFIVIGTGKFRIEDLAANGSFKVYEIIDVIPEPGKPQTNHKFKSVYKEDTKGAVSTITEICGRFLVSQGQKIIIRDLQDDGVVPVAFLDCSVYVSESKSFGNFLLLGDTLKSIWLVGFDAEPFRMIMLGKDLKSIDVNCSDFISKDDEIFILVGDHNNILHLLKYDPEDANSANGQRLVAKASFNINSSVSNLLQLPNLKDGSTQCIGSTIEGSFFTVFPINELSYRRMYILQQQMTDKEFHFCGLNPRLNRFGGLTFNANDSNNKPILDYEVIKSFAKLNDDRKKVISSKISRDTQDIWKDLIDFENCINL